MESKDRGRFAQLVMMLGSGAAKLVPNLIYALLGGLLTYVATTPILLYSIDQPREDISFEFENVGLKPINHHTAEIELRHQVKGPPLIREKYWLESQQSEPVCELLNRSENPMIKWHGTREKEEFSRGERLEFVLRGEDLSLLNEVVAADFHSHHNLRTFSLKVGDIGFFKVIFYGSVAILAIFTLLVAVMISFTIQHRTQVS